MGKHSRGKGCQFVVPKRVEEQMKMKMRKRRREKWREKQDYQDLQKHLKEGRRDCWKKGYDEKDYEMKGYERKRRESRERKDH